jgi:myo-inositol 2-dehydrogenase / D-chiro-inositol 1-dehydrogenase
MPASSLNVGLIGAGRIGRLHAEHLATRIPAARLTVVADVSAEAARQCAERFGVPRAVSDYRVALQDDDVQAVAICSSTDTHAQIIEEAARAGKHIFCEKPIALSLETIDRALGVVERAGVKLQIGFNRRFDASYRRVRQALEEGEIGRPQLLHIISRDPAPPPIEYVRVSGGLFLDMSIHDFDMVRFLTGSEAEEVFVLAGVMVDRAIGEAGDRPQARERRHGHHRQQPPGRLRLRPTRGGAGQRRGDPDRQSLPERGDHQRRPERAARPAAALLRGPLRRELSRRDGGVRG